MLSYSKYRSVTEFALANRNSFQDVYMLSNRFLTASAIPFKYFSRTAATLVTSQSFSATALVTEPTTSLIFSVTEVSVPYLPNLRNDKTYSHYPLVWCESDRCHQLQSPLGLP